MTGTFPDAWQEVALVTIQRKGGTAYQYASLTETIDIAQGDYPGESMMNLAGGRIWKQSPEEDGEITLEIYPTGLGTTASEGLFQEFAGLNASGAYDVAQPLASNTTFVASILDIYRRQRTKFMVAIMWTDDAAQTSAASATTTADATALRFYAKDCRIISHKSEFTDGILKTTITFKFPAMIKAGTTRLWAWESTNDGDGATALPALTYT